MLLQNLTYRPPIFNNFNHVIHFNENYNFNTFNILANVCHSNQKHFIAVLKLALTSFFRKYKNDRLVKIQTLTGECEHKKDPSDLVQFC